MSGVLANALAILAGAFLGRMIRRFMSETISERIETIMGYCTFVLGIKMALQFGNVVLLIVCLALGGVIGTLLRIEKNVELFAKTLERRIFGTESKFALGVST